MSRIQNRKRKRNRLGKCDVCRSVEAKYTCPRCDTVTCGLDCVKKHKSDLECDGVRVKTKYVPANQMNECTFLSDYRLLEGVAQCVEEAEWKRTSLEIAQQQVVADSTSTSDSSKVIVSSSTKMTEDPPEKCSANTVNCADNGDNKHKKNKKKKKSKNSTSAQQISKTDILIAKAERIRGRILEKNKINSKRVHTVHKHNSVMKEPETENMKNIVCELEIDKIENGELDDNNQEVENTSSSSQESSNSNSTSSSSSSSSTIPEEESEKEENYVERTIENNDCAESPISATKEITSIKNQNVSSSENDNEIQKCNFNSEPETTERQLSPEELADLKKEALRKAITIGGMKKAKTMVVLAKAAYTRGIYLTTLPEKFEKHWENSSFFLLNEDCIYWHLKVFFINAEFYTLNLKECLETMSLESVIKGCLQQSEEYHKEQAMEDPLAVYRQVDFSKISVLMAADQLPNNQKKFYILDVSKSLRDNFVGKCIVEFPQLCIGIEDCFVVSSVQESAMIDFFNAEIFVSDEEDATNEFKRTSRVKLEKRKKGEKKHGNHEDESDRESGELTDSSKSDNSCSDDDSEEELFKESEFRSVYTDLLSTFDIDVNQLKK